MPKPRTKGNGEGTIYQNKDKGTWVGTITLGRNDQGKLIRKSVSGKIKREVMDKLDNIKQQAKLYNIIKSEEYSVDQWIHYYLETIAKPALQETSYNSYKRALEQHIIVNFGHYKLSELNPNLIQQVYTKTYQNNTISKSTLKYIHNKFSLTMKYAVKQELLYRNPCQGVVLARLKQPKEIEVLTVENQAKLIEYCRKDSFNYIFIFLLGTGMRIGEVTGLTWDCVDMQNKQISIEKTMIEISGNPKFSDTTKTETSTRKISISDKVFSILEEQKQYKTEENYLNLIFPSTTNNFRTTANLRRRFDLVCSRSEIPRINLHGLRHSFATRMLEKGIQPKIVADILGHKNITTTLNIYTHVLKESQDKYISEIDDFL